MTARRATAREYKKQDVVAYIDDVRRQKWYYGEQVTIRKRKKSSNGLIITDERMTVVECHRDHVVLNNGFYNQSFRKADLIFGTAVAEDE